MSESISCKARALAALETLRSGNRPAREVIRALGEECPGEFFRVVVESLADSFDPVESDLYDYAMSAWGLQRAPSATRVPEHVDVVYVLSRVTLGADIKITSMVLDAMKRRFIGARIVFVGGRKSIELFAADTRLEFVEAAYPRIGPVSVRVAFGRELAGRLAVGNGIVVDPDSRMTQLGLVPLCDPDRYFHFESRSAGGVCSGNLSDLTGRWLVETFGNSGTAYIAPHAVEGGAEATINLGVGENESKRIPGDFEAQLIRSVAQQYATICIDRGAGGEEARRVTAAVEASGAARQVRFWEGSFAGFASMIAQSRLYAGYDSAGQHAAAAAGVPLISFFAGAGSEVFRSRWTPKGQGPILAVIPPLPFDMKQE